MKCFVISPIGQPGSPQREHADDVYECIIQPALEETNVIGHRADHVRDVGRITKQMFDDVLSADFCIAVLHEFNPNVFYELAVAHSAGIPVILMSMKGIDPPFDLKDERVYHYDLSPRAIFQRSNIVGLVEMIESVRRLDGVRSVPFGANLTPLNADSSDLPVTTRVETNAPAEYWRNLVTGTEEKLYLAGVSFTGWKGIQGMREAIKDAGRRGCDIRILTMDVENSSFRGFLNSNVTSVDLDGQRASLRQVRDWFMGALDGSVNADVRALRRGALHQQLVVSDNRCLISPYLYSANTGHSPCLEVKSTSEIYNTFMHEFCTLWDLNGVSEPLPSEFEADEVAVARQSVN